jgi:c-di-GMP-binding flagellar brake protein YcgR
MIKVELKELVGNDRRQFFRVAPSVEEPILLKTQAGMFPLIEISGGGCRLPIAAQAQIQKSVEQHLVFPGRNKPIVVKLSTVVVDEKSIGVEFEGLDDGVREIICGYVRTRELELVRRFRARAVTAS